MVEIRPAGAEDARAAYEVLFEEEPELGATMFEHLFEIGRGHVAETDAGIVGAGVVNRDYGRVWVRPSERRHGVGSRLLAALERDARHGVLRFSARTSEPTAAPFLRANSYAKTAEIWLMGIDLADEPPAPEWAEGVAVRTFREDDAPAVKRLLDEAYAAEPDYAPLDFESWKTFMLGDESYDPDVWFLAERGDELVGAVLTWKEGFVKDLVVSPRARRAGLGKALMLQALGAFRRRGVERVTLKTESTNPTQAVRLYEHLGMATERTDEVFEKRLPG